VDHHSSDDRSGDHCCLSHHPHRNVEASLGHERRLSELLRGSLERREARRFAVAHQRDQALSITTDRA
jgi:hypothetical protein